MGKRDLLLIQQQQQATSTTTGVATAAEGHSDDEEEGVDENGVAAVNSNKNRNDSCGGLKRQRVIENEG